MRNLTEVNKPLKSEPRGKEECPAFRETKGKRSTYLASKKSKLRKGELL